MADSRADDADSFWEDGFWKDEFGRGPIERALVEGFEQDAGPWLPSAESATDEWGLSTSAEGASFAAFRSVVDLQEFEAQVLVAKTQFERLVGDSSAARPYVIRDHLGAAVSQILALVAQQPDAFDYADALGALRWAQTQLSAPPDRS